MMRSPSIKTMRSSSVDSLMERFRSWNYSLSKNKLRARVSSPEPFLQSVQEHQRAVRGREAEKSRSDLSVLPMDSAIHLPGGSELSELREIYSSGDKIFGEHAQNVREQRSPQSSTGRKVCLSRTSSAISRYDDDADFDARVEEVQKSSSSIYSMPSFTQRDDRAIEPRSGRLIKKKSTTRLDDSCRRQEGCDADVTTLPGKMTFMESIKATQRLKSMKSLKVMKVNPHGSLDFQCVGEEFMNGNPFEQFEYEQGKADLLRSLNISRLRLDERNIKILKRATNLDAEAQAIATELDKTFSTPAGSSVTMDEDTQRAQLIGPPGYGGFATGERWATYQYKRHAHHRSTKHIAGEDCACQNYKIFAAITDEQWHYVGIARTKVDRRWVVLLSKTKPSQIPSLTPASSLRRRPMPRTKDRSMTYGTMSATPYASDDEDERPPALPALVL